MQQKGGLNFSSNEIQTSEYRLNNNSKNSDTYQQITLKKNDEVGLFARTEILSVPTSKREIKKHDAQNKKGNPSKSSVANTPMNSTQIHMMTLEDIKSKLGLNLESGLKESQVKSKIKEKKNVHSKNEEQETAVQNDSLLATIFEVSTIWQIISTFFAAIISFVSFGYNMQDGSQILLGLLLIIVAAVSIKIGFCKKGGNIYFELLKSLVPNKCIVIASGFKLRVKVSDLVEGDLIFLSPGDVTPVDCRIVKVLQQDEVIVNNSLFGRVQTASRQELESNLSREVKEKLNQISLSPSYKTLSTSASFTQSYIDSNNVSLQGSNIVQGTFTALVIKDKETSALSQMLKSNESNSKKQEPPLTRQLQLFVNIMSIISILLGVIFIIITKSGFKWSVLNSFLFGSATLLAVTPYSILFTNYLAIKIKTCSKKANNENKYQLLNQNEESSVQFNDSSAFESFQNITNICGGLSLIVDDSQKEIQQLWISRQIIQPQEINQLILKQDETAQSLLSCIAQTVSLNQTSESSAFSLNSIISSTVNSTDSVFGNFINNYIPKSQIIFREGQNDNNEDSQIKNKSSQNTSGNINLFFPFNSEVRLSVSIQEDDNGDCIVYVKGCPSIIWPACSSIQLSNSSQSAINQQILNEFQTILQQHQMKGFTSVAFASAKLNKDEITDTELNQENILKYITNLTFISLVALNNTVNAATLISVAQIKEKGIKINIISNSDANLLKFLAQKAGIVTSDMNVALEDDSSFQLLSDQEWESLVKESDAVIMNSERVKQLLQKDSLELQDLLQTKQVVLFSSVALNMRMQLIEQIGKQNQTLCEIQTLPEYYELQNALLTFSSKQNSSSLLNLMCSFSLISQDGSLISSIVRAQSFSTSHQDNMKKVVAFSCTSQAAYIFAILAVIILRIPLAISPLFMMLIQIFFNFTPQLFLAIDTQIESYQASSTQVAPQGERASTSFKKRSSSLITTKLLVYSFFFLGFICSGAGFVCFYTTMNFLGFPARSIFGISNLLAYYPDINHSEIYGYDKDVVHSFLNQIKDEKLYHIPANSAIKYSYQHWNSFFMIPEENCNDSILKFNLKEERINWGDIETAKADLRKILVYCNATSGSWHTSIDWSICDPSNHLNYLNATGNSVCYTAEALSYAQTAYMLGVIIFQFSNYIALTSQKNSFVLSNKLSLRKCYIILITLVIGVIFTEIPGIHTILRSRPIAFWQWGIPAATFSIFVLIYQEIRKALARSYQWFQKFTDI